MKKFGKKLLALGLAGTMTFSMAACGSGNTENATNTTEQVKKENPQEELNHKIGVAVYSSEDDEVNMFRTYYKDYIENTFDVEFIYSDSLSNIEEEKAFVDSAKEEGCEGIISFVSYDLPEIVNYCDDLYYTVGSSTFSQEDFNEVKNKENFLGIMSPMAQDEGNAGGNMVNHFSEDASKKTWVILSGGASLGNFMHTQRAIGMLETLQNTYGFQLEGEAEDLACVAENTVVANHPDGGKVIVSPGYFMIDEFRESVLSAIEENDADLIASVCTISSIADELAEIKNTSEKDIKIGAVDCFSVNNGDAFLSDNLHYLEGKCQAMAAPAFIAMYNAITGHSDIVKPDGEAFWLNQGFWTATNLEEYENCMEKASNIYTNIYGSKDMMNVIGIYNKNASFEDFKQFVDVLNENK